MTPNTLNCRKRQLCHEHSSKVSISSKRSAAANARWQLRVQPHDENSDSDIELEELRSDEEDLTEPFNSSKIDLTTPAGKKHLQRLRLMLLQYLPAQKIDYLALFVKCYNKFCIDGDVSEKLSNITLPDGSMNRNQQKYSLGKIVGLFNSNKDITDHLFQVWISRLLSHPLVESYLKVADITFPANQIPKKFVVSQIVSRERKQLVSCASNSSTSLVQRKVVINVAENSALSTDSHGDVTALAEAVSCSFRFAKSVITAVANGEEGSLLTRNVRCDALLATDWPTKLESYVLEPENSRAVPGNKQVSIRYGVRHAKYVLLKSRQEIAGHFIQLYPECDFKTSTLIREFPPYAVTATNRDMDRNTCPIHANVRHLVKLINKTLRREKADLCHVVNWQPVSCVPTILSPLIL